MKTIYKRRPITKPKSSSAERKMQGLKKLKLDQWISRQNLAVSTERMLIKSGFTIGQETEKFHKRILAFRETGLWACTPRQHRTWASWCYYAAPKMKLARSTLQAYGSKTYIINKSRTRQMTIGSFYVYGEASIFLKRAIIRAVYLGYTGQSRRGLKRMAARSAVTAIAKHFLSTAKRVGPGSIGIMPAKEITA